MANSRPELARHTEYPAETFAGVAQAAIKAAGGLFTPPTNYHYFPKAFYPSWVAATPLGIESGQKITLAANMDFQEYDPADADEAYHEQRRTKIHGRLQTNWLNKAGEYLMRRYEYPVTFIAYESTPGDKTLGPHTDEGLVLTAQWHGEKAWRLGLAACKSGHGYTLLTTPGDVLIIPKDYPHEAFTPTKNGSLHLAANFRTDYPLEIGSR